jgi:glycosyltransferase involved in cell wall biosynthesis
MKIVIGVHHLPPHYQGGAEKIALLTAKALSQRGHEIMLIAVERVDYQGATQIYWEDEILNGIQTRRLYFNGTYSFAPNPFEYNNPLIRSAMENTFDEFMPDLFYLIGGYLLSGSVIEAAAEKKIPVIVKLTDLWYLCPRITMLRTDGEISTLPIDPRRCARCIGEEKRRYRIPGQLAPVLMDFYWGFQKTKINYITNRQKFLHDVMEKVRIFISESNFLRDMYIMGGMTPEKIIQSRQGIDFASWLEPADLIKIPSSQLRVAYFGQLANHKGIHILIKAVKKIQSQKVSLWIYGDDSAFPKYSTKLRKLAGEDERINFCKPYRTATEQSKLLREIDVVVVPSIWYENSPNVVLEVHGNHTPVIASNFAGLPEMIIEGENGLLFERGNVDDLASKIVLLLENPELLAKLTEKSGENVRTIDDEMDMLEQTFAEHCGK